MFKKFLKVIGSLLVVLLLGIAAFAVYVAVRPNDFAVERSLVIAAPPEELFAQVNDLAAWDAWSPWKELDPKAQYKLSSPSVGVGANMWWSGNDKVGEGTLTIVESKPTEKIELEQVFTKPMQGASRAAFTFTPDGDKTKVTWRMYGKYGSFMEKAVCQLMNMDKMVGGKFDEGLANLKRVSEVK